MEQVTITLRRDDEDESFSVNVVCDPPINHLEPMSELQVLAQDFVAKVKAVQAQFADTEVDDEEEGWEPT